MQMIPTRGFNIYHHLARYAFCQRQSAERMKSNVFWRAGFTTTTASLRSICLNDLYHYKDLRELAVEGDIHAIISVLQMNVPWMPNRRKRDWEKWAGAPRLASFLEKGIEKTAQTLGLGYLSYRFSRQVE